MKNIEKISANLVDIHKRDIYPASIEINNGKITKITRNNEKYSNYIIPAFIDAHIHIESSMLIPSQFGKIAIKHGTVATVSDPHEIANVMGQTGIEFMIENSKDTPLKIYFGAPSCVPATQYETSGATLDSNGIEQLLQRDEIKYLSEMMNFPGVIYDDIEVLQKITIAQKYDKPIDGHAPLLSGILLDKYISAGISTDHECTTLKEAEEKIRTGMKILIRSGSAVDNFEELYPLIDKYPDKVMFCSDDRHPDGLVKGLINLSVKRAIEKGCNIFNILKASNLNAIEHYNLEVGSLKIGDYADFVLVTNLSDFDIQKTIINGNIEYDKCEIYRTVIDKKDYSDINNFNIKLKNKSDFIYIPTKQNIKVIEAIDNSLITKVFEYSICKKCIGREFQSTVKDDVLKIVNVNRYEERNPAIAFIKNFGLKKGAIATSVAHDSHNILAVGVNDELICKVVNSVIENKGGLAIYHNKKVHSLPLPIAGLMSSLPVEDITKQYIILNNLIKYELGSKLTAPFMTLSFMALLVIPEIKLSDKGLFDSVSFDFF